MTTHTHVSAPTQYIEGDGIKFAYRKFGPDTGTPLIFCVHFRGNMDNWDPMVTDGLAQDRPVILFDNAGVSSTSGETPDTIAEMGKDVGSFVKAMGLQKVDVLGFSIGGYVAQEFALQYPALVRKIVLVGTGPRNGEPATDPRIAQSAGTPVPSLDDFLFLFFAPTETSQAAGRAFWKRRLQRADQDPASSMQTAKAQVAALMEWRQPKGERFAYLKAIKQPTLVVNGSNDIMVPTVNSYTLAQHLPDAQLIIYPDSGHASQFQFPELFVAHVRLFLNA